MNKKINKKINIKTKKNDKINMKKVFILIVILILIFIILFTIFNKNESKTQKIGKNSSSQDIVDYILDISSYETTIEVEINSNKNNNKYMLKQQYIKNKVEAQEVLEPSNIKGIKIVKKDNNLKLENTKLNLTTILDKYEYLTNNALDLNVFIEDYKNDNSSTFEEKNGEIIMKTSSRNDNKYTKNKVLYVDKNTGKPKKMEITDINKNITVYILYKEVKIDSINENNILAFSLYNMKKEV